MPALPAGHAKEALSLAQMQEQTLQLEQQSKLKVSVGPGMWVGGARVCWASFWICLWLVVRRGTGRSEADAGPRCRTRLSSNPRVHVGRGRSCWGSMSPSWTSQVVGGLGGLGFSSGIS